MEWTDDYLEGLKDGFIDGCIISQPPTEGEHTYQKYCEVSYKYKSCISPFVLHTRYSIGYGIGLDCAAIYLRIELEEN